MEFRNLTRRKYVNRILSLWFLLLMSYMVYIMVEASVSCIDEKGCLKRWCEKSWFPADIQDQIDKRDCD